MIAAIETAIIISTHTLTWSVTLIKAVCVGHYRISTHTLTWSVTRHGRHCGRTSGHFNSHAHVERDDCERDWDENVLNFNSHAHVERDSEFLVTRNENIGFQLTRSRGA